MVRDIEPAEFKNNVMALAKLTKYFDLPAVMTTSFEQGPNGPMIPELKEMFKDSAYVARPGQINAWDNDDFVQAIKDTGRKQLIIAGIVTEVCVAFPALSALAEGYEVFVVTDASGTFNELSRNSAIDRMVAAGALRVINDDHVIGGQGFGKHSHRDMEIISIPLAGKLGHGDNIGNNGIIETGEIQVMSAGTGITHSEMNGDNFEDVKFLQIWVIPNKANVEPRYQQVRMDELMQPNEFNQILSPNPNDAGVWIHQNAWFHMGSFDKGVTKTYDLKDPNNGVYVLVLEGKVTINGNTLDTRDGLGIWDTKSFTMDVDEEARVLLMEVPMR